MTLKMYKTIYFKKFKASYLGISINPVREKIKSINQTNIINEFTCPLEECLFHLKQPLNSYIGQTIYYLI